MTKSTRYLNLAYFLLIPLILFFHYELIIKDPILWRDDFALISTVAKTNSLRDYFQNLFQGHYFDLQPIRDFTFYLNLKIQELFNYGGYHLTNLVISGFALYLFRKFLKTLKFDELTILIVIVVLAVHPVLNGASAWISNRKHLLSLLFILLFVNQSMKEENSSWKSFLWCLLSFLSQPITIFIPGLVILYRRVFDKRFLKFWDYGIIAISISIFVANYSLYQDAKFADRKFTDNFAFQPDLYLLNLGRVTTQIVFPIRMGLEYDPGSYLSMVGLFLTVLILFLIYKYQRSIKELILILIALTPLFTVIRWGPKEAYILSTLLLAGYFLCRIIQGKDQKKVILGIVPLFLFFSFQTRKFTPMWQNDLMLGKISYENEGGYLNTSFYAIQLAKIEPDNCYIFLNEVFNIYPSAFSPQMMFLRAKCLFDLKMSDADKIAIFRKEQNPDLFATFYEAKLLEKMGELEKSNNAYKALVNSMQDPAVKNLFWDKMCIKEKNEYECKKLQELSQSQLRK